MDLRDLRHLLSYDEWANSRLLACTAALPDEDWRRDLGGSFPTLQKTLAHVVGAEATWLRRWRGDAPTAPPEWLADPSPDLLRGVLDGVETERAAFLDALADADLDRPIAYTLFSGQSAVHPLGVLALHVTHHSAFHRGQAAAMLRRLGVAPPATDLLVFSADAAER